jgi:tRNA (guanine-N7-)-methyltransferase
LGPDGAFRRIYVNFPDPWWKKRHQKRLVVAAGLLDPLARVLAPRGELFIQTDVEDRAQQYEALLAMDARFCTAGDAPGSARLQDNPYGARSPRERRALADGLPIVRLGFFRVG